MRAKYLNTRRIHMRRSFMVDQHPSDQRCADLTLMIPLLRALRIIRGNVRVRARAGECGIAARDVFYVREPQHRAFRAGQIRELRGRERD
jgi:hypothetical protein